MLPERKSHLRLLGPLPRNGFRVGGDQMVGDAAAGSFPASFRFVDHRVWIARTLLTKIKMIRKRF